MYSIFWCLKVYFVKLGKFLIRIIDLVRISRDGYMYIKRWFIFRFIIIKNVWMVVYLLYFSFLCVFIIINSCVYNFINVFVIMIFLKCLNKKDIEVFNKII